MSRQEISKAVAIFTLSAIFWLWNRRIKRVIDVDDGGRDSLFNRAMITARHP